jgi:hypothetical protein
MKWIRRGGANIVAVKQKRCFLLRRGRNVCFK